MKSGRPRNASLISLSVPVYSVTLLTGDRVGPAAMVAEQVGITMCAPS